MQWTKIDSWHAIDATWVSNGYYWVRTQCGMERVWDQTFVDSLPGGTEEACENCLIVVTGAPEEEEPKKPARRKK